MYRTLEGQLRFSTCGSATTIFTGTLLLPSGTTAAAPSLASHDGKLYCMIRGASNEQLHWTAATNPRTDNFPTFTSISASSGTAPAIASYNGTLYCLHRG